jgi:hypothetical protein
MLGGAVQAAQPSWQVGHGTNYLASPAPASGASSSSVAAGKTVGFFEWLHNNTPSNISQLYMNATTTPTATLVGASWTIQDDAQTVLRQGTCVPTTASLCSFGALNSGETVYVTAAFTTSANLANGATQKVLFTFNATGNPPGKNQSHGDVVPLADEISISNNGDADGDFNFNGTEVAVATAPVGGNNRQSTSLTLGGTLVGAAVADNPQLSTPCNASLIGAFPTWFSCSLLSSLTSVVEAGNGKEFNNPNEGNPNFGTPGIKVIVSFKDPKNQLVGSNPFAYHYWEDASGAHAELITSPCVMSGGFPTNSGPCLTVVNNKQVIVWLTHNGNMRM